MVYNDAAVIRAVGVYSQLFVMSSLWSVNTKNSGVSSSQDYSCSASQQPECNGPAPRNRSDLFDHRKPTTQVRDCNCSFKRQDILKPRFPVMGPNDRERKSSNGKGCMVISTGTGAYNI